eukprot:scaffold142592_cov178-Phaeocystis_antarctica.AAC.1
MPRDSALAPRWCSRQDGASQPGRRAAAGTARASCQDGALAPRRRQPPRRRVATDTAACSRIALRRRLRQDGAPAPR